MTVVRIIRRGDAENPDVQELLEQESRVNLNNSEPLAPYSRDSSLNSAIFEVSTDMTNEELRETVASYFEEFGGLTNKEVVEVMDDADTPW